MREVAPTQRRQGVGRGVSGVDTRKFGRWVDSVLMQRAPGQGDAALPARDPPGRR